MNCTFRAIRTFASIGDPPELSIWGHFPRFARDACEPVGFELLLPMLFDEARQYNLDLPYELCAPNRQLQQKVTKTGQFEQMIQRIVAFHASFYGSRKHSFDYHTISSTVSFRLIQGIL